MSRPGAIALVFGRFPEHREGARVERDLRLPLDSERGSLQRAYEAKLYADAYSVAPAGIFVPFDSAITAPVDLAGVPISVGYRSRRELCWN
jgi:hypothetical protein